MRTHRQYDRGFEREVLASASAAQAGSGKERTCSFSAKDRQTGSPGSCCAHPNHLSQSSSSILVFQKKTNPQTSPSSADNPSTQQASSAVITLTASHETPSEPEFWLHWHLTNHIKVPTYTFVPIFVSPCNISFRFHWFVYFLIKDFDILKPFYISYPGNIQRRTTQMGK